MGLPPIWRKIEPSGDWDQAWAGARASSHPFSSDVAFTPSIKAVQTRQGSRSAYSRMEERGFWESRITPDLAAFIGAAVGVFLATACGRRRLRQFGLRAGSDSTDD
jgi:hypothetical protein